MNECLININYYVLYGGNIYNVFVRARLLLTFPNKIAIPLESHTLDG
jgi:hypothetical protein